MNLFPHKYLFQDIAEKQREYRLPYSNIPSYITDNLRFSLFKWQKNALLNFLDYTALKEYEQDSNPTHLMFNMATGSGKTLVMAALILYYYKQGQNKFIFFVNQKNIVGKTDENLTNIGHNKYLFQPNIIIDDQIVKIKKVRSFSEYDNDIQIIFTTIHQLHNSVYLEKEDNITLQQLQKTDIVMLGDEAHHLNATTKADKNQQTSAELTIALSEKASQEQIEKSWEHTIVQLILYRNKQNSNQSNRNALLEFTATVPNEEAVRRKYLSKIIMKFDLEQFMAAGYTKEINLVSSSFDQRKRVLQALLFNWYRNEIALKYNIPNFKPVILFRSKFIDKKDGNNSQDDYQNFIDLIKELQPSDFDFLKPFETEGAFENTELYQRGQSCIVDIARYKNENNLSNRNIVRYLKNSFLQRNCIITNSKKGTSTLEKTDSETERLLNSLEDKNNHIRAIFTVQRLTEGWDVLNLFDIVRMYEGRDSGATTTGTRKAGKATTAEVQLIGRGVRYYPFDFEDKEGNKRKFDGKTHDLRVLEEFYFHSDNDERYINELKDELKRQKLLPEKESTKKTFNLKKTFKNSNVAYFESLQLYQNSRISNPNSRKSNLDEIRKNFEFEYRLESLRLIEAKLKLNLEIDEVRFKHDQKLSKTLKLKLDNFEKHIVLKAINKNAAKQTSVFRFNKLKNELKINSVNDLLTEKLLKNFEIKIIAPQSIQNLSDIENHEQLKILSKFFEQIAVQLQTVSNPFIGSEFNVTPFKDFDWQKTKLITADNNNETLEKELLETDWYIYDGFYGTSEEQNLILFLKDTISNFRAKYEKVHLLRNEEVYKIYDFDQGRGFQPDFLLFLKSINKETYYQLFIEPKGVDRISNDDSKWKEEFLKQISDKYSVQEPLKIQNKDYVLYGLPLYNQQHDLNFKKAINENLQISI